MRISSNSSLCSMFLMSLLVVGCAAPQERDEVSGDGALLRLVDEARIDYRSGRYSAARQKLEQVLEKTPKDPAMNARTGNAAYREGQYELAAEYYENAIEFTTEPLPRIRYNLAMVRLTQASLQLEYLRQSDESNRLSDELDDLFDALDQHVGRRVPPGVDSDMDGVSSD
ncbi:MAG: tetratricopeptide repeat protein [Spiribacter salinus]|uniref:Tetratricopeptide repeat protein n=1 Tax=Spiribacter salinus TaxID=1335746 RepID=A0A540VT21_9GAMM|nr:MAG: tetratricopeptide repeat protein [Spiribacter salinus]